MTLTYDRAIDRVRDEMAKHHDNPGICAVGEVLTALLAAAPEYAAAMLDDKHNLKGAYEALEAYARQQYTKNRRNCVYVPQDTAERVILEYYGLTPDRPADSGHTETPSPLGFPSRGAGALAPERSSLSPALPSLDDLLEAL